MSAICPICFPDCRVLGEICEGYYLVKQGKSRHGIFDDNHHAGSCLYWFPINVVPFVDPDPECEGDDETHAVMVDCFRETWDVKVPLGTGLANTYFADEDREKGHFFYWLFNKCGAIIENK